MVNGSPIDEYSFRQPVAQITYSMAYELEQSRLYAGITAAEFDAMPGSPEWCTDTTGWRSKCHVLLLYRMSKTIPAVAEDAANKEMERNSKRRH